MTHSGPPASRAFGRRLALRRPALCPEIALWLIAEEVDLEAACGALGESQAPPYWAFCWGAGQALARYLLDHPHEVADKHVVDFGSGSGVAGIAAALAGARSVTCVDLDPLAREASHANALANETTERVATAASVPEAWDVFLASDVRYEQPAAQHVLIHWRRRSPDAAVLVAEPHRPGNSRWEREALASYDVRTTPDVDPPTRTASVYRL